MDRWTQIGTDRYTEGYPHTCWEQVLRCPTDLAASWPLQRVLKRLEDNPLLLLSVPHSLPPSFSLYLFLSSTFCPRFGLCPDNQSEWWLCFQLSQPPFLYHRIISSCSVGNIQESRADEPKEMFWDAASTAKPNWDQTHIGLSSGKGGGETLCR